MATGVFSSKDVSHVSKFNGTNFSFWKFQITLILEQHELCDIVLGKSTKPAPLPAGSDAALIAARDKEIMLWNKKDNSARCFIVSTIEEQAQISLINCKTAHEMWTRLKSQHEQNSEENKHYLLQMFYAYEYEEGGNVTSHITAMETMATDLSDLGNSLPPEQVIGKIIMTLPPSYRYFHSAWNNVESNKKTVALLTSRLQAEETLHQFQGLGTADKSDSALFSRNQREKSSFKGNKSYNKPGNGDQRKPCGFCKKNGHKSGHREEDCWRKASYIQGRRDAGDTAYAATNSGHTKPTNPSNTPSSDDDYAFVSNIPEMDKHEWYADSGARSHMTDKRCFFETFQSIKPGSRTIRGIGKDNALLSAHGIGSIRIKRKIGGKWSLGTIHNVLYVPNLGANLFSIGVATQRGVTATFQDDRVTLSKNGKNVASGTRSGEKLYRMDFVVSEPTMETKDFAAVARDGNIQLWHERLGHVNFPTIKKMQSLSLVEGMKLTFGCQDTSICEGCIMGKHHRQPFPKDGRTRATRIGEIIHSDVCGPITPSSIGGSKYFVIFKDDFSCYCFIEFMKTKSEVTNHFKNFAARMKTLTGYPVVTFRSDNGGEYMSQELDTWLKENGIRHETSIARTPEQNGVSERENRTVVESARSMLLTSNLPREMWAEAVNCANYVLNRVPSKATPNKTPYEHWFNSKPNLAHLRVFGCDAYLHVPKEGRSKFESKSLKCCFVGYADTQKGFRLWDPVHRKVKIGRDIRFDEQLSSKQRSSTESFSDPVTPVEFEVGGDLQVSTGRAAEFNSLPGETLDNAETTEDANEHEEPFHGFESTDTSDNGTRTRQSTRIIKRPQRLIEDTNFLSFDQHVPQVLDEPQT